MGGHDTEVGLLFRPTLWANNTARVPAFQARCQQIHFIDSTANPTRLILKPGQPDSKYTTSFPYEPAASEAP
jgi:hypothetical protein